jgi:sec-independent protein translocase protein TatA
MGGLSIWHLLILLAIALVIFGTKRLTGGAKDVANAVKEFKKALRDDEKPQDAPAASKVTDPNHDAVDQAKPPSVDDKTPRA